MSLYDKIKTANDIASETLDVPAWDATLLIKAPNGRERAELLNLLVADEGDERRVLLFPLVVALTACDPDTGDRLFTRDDIDWLLTKSGRVLQDVAQVGMRLAGLVADAVDEGKGDLSEIPTGDTDSGSPSDSE